MDEKVELSYEGIANTIHVPAHRVAGYEARGWKRVTEASHSKATPSSATPKKRSAATKPGKGSTTTKEK